MSHAQELLDVVILTWNDAALLDTAVDSVLASTGVEVSVVVVDNGSVPPARVVQDARVQQLRNEQNRGVAAARNQGCRVGRAEYVCFLDSDAWVEPPALAALVQVLRQDPTVALVGPVFAGQRPTASGGRAPSLGRKVARALGMTSDYAPAPPESTAGTGEVDFVIGACQVFRRAAFEAVGGLDESYFYGPEDVDLCLRLRAAGWRIVQVEDAAVHHPARRRHRSLFKSGGMAHARNVARHLWRHRRHP